MKHQLSKMGMIFLCGFLGGVAGRWLSPTDVQAYGAQAVVQAQRFELVDASGRVLAQMGPSAEGSGAIWFFDNNGRPRLNAGVYGDGNPFVALLAPSGDAKGLFRTAGAANAPVVVLKNAGQDRIILGMDLRTGNQPGLMYIDEKGQRKDIFGQFKL